MFKHYSKSALLIIASILSFVLASCSNLELIENKDQENIIKINNAEQSPSTKDDANVYVEEDNQPKVFVLDSEEDEADSAIDSEDSIEETETPYTKLNTLTSDVELLSLSEVFENRITLGAGGIPTCDIFTSFESLDGYRYTDFVSYLKDILYDDFFDTYNLIYITYPHSSSVTGFNYTGYKVENNVFYSLLTLDAPNAQDMDVQHTFFLFAVNKRYDIKYHSIDATNTSNRPATFPYYLLTSDDVWPTTTYQDNGEQVTTIVPENLRVSANYTRTYLPETTNPKIINNYNVPERLACEALTVMINFVCDKDFGTAETDEERSARREAKIEFYSSFNKENINKLGLDAEPSYISKFGPFVIYTYESVQDFIDGDYQIIKDLNGDYIGYIFIDPNY